MPKVTAHLKTLPAVDVEGHTVESLTAKVQLLMRQGLAELQQKVLQTEIQPQAETASKRA